MDEDREIIERRIAAAKRSMATRLNELGERLDRTRRTLSFRQKVQEHPAVVFGAALAVGLVVGWRRGSAARSAARVVESRALMRAPQRGLVATAVHEILRSLVATVAARAAARMVQQMGQPEVGDFARLGDPDDSRTTGVRIYPLT